jgi:phosphoglycolate phosphatase-like HAD superfamily hydrolase
MAQVLASSDWSSSGQSVIRPAFPFVVFDMNGTLIDTFQLNLRSLNYAVRRFLKRTLTTEEALGIQAETLEEQLTNYMPLGAVPQAIERFHAHYYRHFNSPLSLRVAP